MKSLILQASYLRVYPDTPGKGNGLRPLAEVVGDGSVRHRNGDGFPLTGEPVDGGDYPEVGRMLTGWHSCS